MFIFQKQPAESYTIGVEFEDKLPTGASPNSGAVSATDRSGADATATVLTGTVATISGTQARIKVQAGLHGQDYRIRFLVTLTNTDVFEEDGIMEVRNQ